MSAANTIAVIAAIIRECTGGYTIEEAVEEAGRYLAAAQKAYPA